MLPTRPKKSYNSWHDVGLCDAKRRFMAIASRRAAVTDDEVPATPLSLLIELMQRKWVAGDRDGAAALARAAAPYLHHRLGPIGRETDQTAEAHLLTDAELERRIEALRQRERLKTEDPDVTG